MWAADKQQHSLQQGKAHSLVRWLSRGVAAASRLLTFTLFLKGLGRAG